MLHRKPHIENHLKSAEGQLAGRIELLTTNGVEPKRIKKDNTVKFLEAKIRQAKKQLGSIENLKKELAANAEARIQKMEAAKAEKMDAKPKKKDKTAPPAKKRNKPRSAEEGEK